MRPSLGNRLGFALSSCALVCLVFAASARAADGRIAASSAPAWGTDHSSVLTLTAADLESDDLQDSLLSNNLFRKCLSAPIAQPSCRFRSGLSLPSGALIEYVEFAVCDPDADGFGAAHLSAWEGLEADGPIIASITTQGDGGCSLWTSGFVGVTVDNLTTTYAVTVQLSGEVTFRAVRIFYSLQVSPAPGFASFNDVPTSHPLFQYIEALYASGITAGCGGGNFCPGAALTRGQMAVFLSRALGLYFPN